jgi:hypothetical protein
MIMVARVSRNLLDCTGLNMLFVRQSSAGKNVGMETENIVEIRYQATTGEDKAN